MATGDIPPSSGREPVMLDPNMKIEKKFKSHPERVFWVTAEIAEGFEREYYLVATAREMVFYLIFLFCATMTVVVKIDHNAFYMTDGIKGQVVHNKFLVNNQIYTFKDVRTLQDMQIYLTESLGRILYWSSFDTVTRVQISPKDRGVLYSNKLIGEPTMRQLAMQNNSCDIHPRFERHYKSTCKEGYRHRRRLRDERLPNCNVPSGCEYKDSSETLAVSYYGVFGHYGSDGYQLKMGQDWRTFVANVESLKTNGWYSEATRAIFLDFMVYNPNLDMFCGVKLVFETPPVGGVFAKAKFHTFQPLVVQRGPFGQFADGCLIVCAVLVLYYIAEEIREMVYWKFKYLTFFWAYIELVMYGLLVTHIILHVKAEAMARKLLKPMSENSADIKDFSLQSLSYYQNLSSNVQGFAIFLIYMKVFKYLNLNLVTGQLNNTLKRSGRYLLFFSTVFLLIFLAFSEFGYLVFGTEILEYSTLSRAMFTLSRTLLGDFFYDELEETHYIIAPIFFVLFIFCVFFVLANMFLAIICGNYTYVKTDMAVGPEVMQMTEFWKRGAHNVCSAMKCYACANMMAKRNEYNVAAEQLRSILNRCGFSNLDVDVFMARYNIEPENLVKVKDVSRLIEYLKLPAAEYIKPKKGEPPTIDAKPAAPPVISIEDFNLQQKKLEEIETYMNSIAERLDTLLKKITALQEIRR